VDITIAMASTFKQSVMIVFGFFTLPSLHQAVPMMSVLSTDAFH
jgi:hypothetical protein